MPKSTLVRVKDEGTDMVFLVVKFVRDDAEILNSKGWSYSPELCVIAAIGPEIRASMSIFDYPLYDIEERSGTLGANHTTVSLAEVLRDIPFDEISDLIDVTNHIPDGWPIPHHKH